MSTSYPPPGDPRLAVVTGAASGMGLATARLLSERGASVVGVDLADAPDELRTHDAVGWVRGDVAEQATWERVRAAVAEHGPDGADCLVCCAAALVVKPFMETTPEDYRRLFEVNVLGAIHGLHALLPAMVERRRGAVVIVCSVDSLYVEAAAAAYAASKAALLQVARSAALEHARDGLQINAVLPGIVETPMLERAFDANGDADAARAACLRRSPQGRLLRPEQIAETICFLLSERASGIGGAAVTVDGGLTSTYDFDSGPEA